MKPQYQKYLAELLGTFVLVFVGITAMAGEGAGVAPFAFGLALLAALYAFGEVSGGHFNPGVSLGMFLDRRLGMVDLVKYWIAQFIGGILAALALLLMTSSDAVSTTATVPNGNRAAFFAELFLTAIFVLVVLQVTKSKGYGSTSFVAMALALMGVHFAGVHFSGMSVNLARSLGPALVGNHWTGFWIYILATPAGAILGWIAHTVAVKGDTNLRDDFDRVKGDVRGGMGQSQA